MKRARININFYEKIFTGKSGNIEAGFKVKNISK